MGFGHYAFSTRPRRICDEKVRMDGISKITKPEEIHNLMVQLKIFCGDRYFLLLTWFEWLMTLMSPPDEEELNQWAGGHREAVEV